MIPRQGFVQFIKPAQQWSTSLVSHMSSQDSLPRHHRYIYLQPTHIVQEHTFQPMVPCPTHACSKRAHISNPWSHAQPMHVVQGRGTKDSIFQNFHALSQSLDTTFLYSNSIFLVLVFLIIERKYH
jgi:hypothetical protein